MPLRRVSSNIPRELSMKRLFVQAALICFLLYISSPSGYADSVFDLSGSATILWSSLKLTADPGVTVTWLPGSISASGEERISGLYGQTDPHTILQDQSA